MSLWLSLASLVALTSVATAQTNSADTAVANGLPGRCSSLVTKLPAVSDQSKIAAQDLAGRAQSSSINGDNAAATDLYQKAAQLDPTDAGIAYALGREYEAVRDPRAMKEYCRFLSLTPTAAEAADVRQRVAELALALPPDTTVVRIRVPAAPRMPTPGAALGSGLLFPGLGQFTTHRPLSGVFVMVATGAAAGYALLSQNVTSVVTHTATDPLGHPYQYTTTETHTEYPHAAVGAGTAAAVYIIAAFNAFSFASSHRDAPAAQQSADSRPPHSAAPFLSYAPRSLGFGVAIR